VAKRVAGQWLAATLELLFNACGGTYGFLLAHAAIAGGVFSVRPSRPFGSLGSLRSRVDSSRECVYVRNPPNWFSPASCGEHLPRILGVDVWLRFYVLVTGHIPHPEAFEWSARAFLACSI
jgi:hypothetical protein